MRWFSNLKIGTKLISAFILVALISVLVGYVGISKIQSIDISYSELIEHNLRPLGDIGSAAVFFQRSRANLRDILIDTTSKDMEEHAARISQLDKEMDKSLENFEKTIQAEELKLAFRTFKDLNAKFDPVRDRIVKLARDGKKEDAVSVMRGEAFQLAQSVQESLDKLVQMKITQAEKESAQNTAQTNSAVKFMLTIAGCGLFLTLGFGFIISRLISKPIKNLAAAAEKLALGDVSVNIEATTKDEIGLLARAFRNTIDNIKEASMAAEKVAAGDLKTEVKIKSENDLLGKGLNSMLETIRNLLAETETLIKATQDGKLDTRGNAAKYEGAWNEMVQGVNRLIDAFVAPINVTAEYVDRISKGDIPSKINDEYKGDFNEIKNNLNNCIDNINALVADANTLEQAALLGKLATRADATKHGGDYRKIVQGVNNTLDAVIGPLNVSAEYVDRISKGDIPTRIIDEYKGDFNEIKNNLNNCIDNINALVADANMLEQAALQGKLATRADATKHNGDYRKIVEGVNNCLDAVIGPLNVSAEYVDKISKGEIPQMITDEYKGDFNEIKNNLNATVKMMNDLLSETDKIIKAAANGELDKRADATLFVGGWNKLVSGVNDTITNIVDPLMVTADYVEKVSKGVIPPTITTEYKGQYNIIKKNLNAMVKMMNELLAETDKIIQAAANGELDKRADATLFVGGWNKLVSGVNDTITNIVAPLNVSAEYVDRISKGDIPAKIVDEYKGDFNEIKNNLNNCIDNINALVTDANMLEQAALQGKLATRADATKHGGDYRKIVEGVNNCLDAVIGPLNVSAEYVDRISKGDIPTKIVDEYKGDFNEIKNNLNNCIDNINALVTDANMLEQAALLGKLATRADATKHNGDYRKIVEGVNNTLDAVIGPLNVSAEYVDRISKGDIPTRIVDEYKGDFNEIKNNLNNCIDNINALVADANMLAQAALDGKLATRADATKHGGDYRKIVEGVNRTLDAVIGPLNVSAEYVDKISKGEIPQIITDIYNGDFNEIKNNLNATVKMMNDLLSETDKIIKAAANGELEKRADATLFVGGWNKLVSGVNDTITNIVDPLMVTADYVDKVARGIIPPTIVTEYKGQYNIIKNNLNAMVKMMNELLAETEKIVQAAANGELDKRADAGLFVGGWNKLVAGVNDTIKNIVDPLMVTADYVEKVSRGVIPPKISTEYKGQYNLIKNNLHMLIDAMDEVTTTAEEIASGNLTVKVKERSAEDKLMQAMAAMVRGLTEVASNIQTVAHQVTTGSQEMNTSSEELSQGATEQSASVEEVSSSMEQMAANIKQNSENAQQTEKIAIKAAEDGKESGTAVAATVNAMKEIAGKISIIEEIARQTNLLALNAAIEAARAGEHGKGFAVVASEVRKLAERSQTAAGEINKLSVSSVKVAEKAGEMLAKIVPDIQRTADLVQEITAASNEQTSGAGQINKAIQQLDQVVQQNAAASEQMASTSTELLSQAEQLQTTIAFFKINGSSAISKSVVSTGRMEHTTSHKAKAKNSTSSKMPEKGKHSGSFGRAHPGASAMGGVVMDMSKGSNGEAEMTDEDFGQY